MNAPFTRTVTHAGNMNALAGITSYRAVYMAIGYLSVWALTEYPTLTLTYNDNIEGILAVFSGEERGNYVIDAIYNTDLEVFTFHS